MIKQFLFWLIGLSEISKDRSEIRGLYVIGLLAVFLTLYLVKGSIFLPIKDISFDIMPLIKISIVCWIGYSSFEIVGYSDDLVGNRIASTFRIYSPMFLLVSFWITGITFFMLAIIILFERLLWIGSLFGIFTIIALVDFLFGYKDRYQKGFFTELSNKIHQIDKEILFGSLFLTSSALVAYGPLEYIWLFWIVSLFFMFAMIYFRYKKPLKKRVY